MVESAIERNRAAFLEESGEALIRRHAGVDSLFTPGGYRGYADDLLARMTNPFLRDTVERVGRDPERKLAWDDRLLGTIRMALKVGLTPWRYATGTAAALLQLDPALLDGSRSIAELADRIWRPGAPDPAEQTAVVKLIEQARRRLSSQ
jgi:mannitol-1-phosphate 5-dehydrogenase